MATRSSFNPLSIKTMEILLDSMPHGSVDTAQAIDKFYVSKMCFPKTPEDPFGQGPRELSERRVMNRNLLLLVK